MIKYKTLILKFYKAKMSLNSASNKAKHRSISLNSRKSVNNNNLSSFLTNNLSPTNKPKTKSNKSKSNASKPELCFSTLPKVSIDLNETPTLTLEEVIQLRRKLKELTNDKIKFLNKNYIKELKTLKETIDITLFNNCITNNSSMNSNVSSSSPVHSSDGLSYTVPTTPISSNNNIENNNKV